MSVKNQLKDNLIKILYNVEFLDDFKLEKINETAKIILEDISSECEQIPKKEVVVKTTQPEVKPPIVFIDEDYEYCVEKLKDPLWKVAVDPNFIIGDNENEKLLRARAIVSTMELDVSANCRILDFGCGEGHVVNLLAKSFYQSFVVGYDVKKQWKTEPVEPNFLTTDFEKVEKSSPYDVVIFYDVLDHCEEDPYDVLMRVRKLVKPGGKMKIRFHPYCSAHGSHHYHYVNKAFVHLMFNDEEMKKLGVKELPFTRKVLNPIQYYEELVKKTGMNVLFTRRMFSQTGPIFENNPRLKKRLLERNYPELHNIDYSRIETTFIDYWLEA